MTTVASYIQYNAYRWLRDSGFSVGQFVSSNATVSAEPLIVSGLLRYSQLLAAFPGSAGLGVLDFGADEKVRVDLDMRPVFFKPWVGHGVDTITSACVLGGVGLILRSRKRAPEPERGEPDAESAPSPGGEVREPPEALNPKPQSEALADSGDRCA
jgi:hypothetical protein